MFVLCDHESYRVPIKVWLRSGEDLEPECLIQSENLARLPFIHKHVALMPDTHSGYGMPIGGVIATKDVVIPNAVGVDIGCGVVFLQTNLLVEDLRSIDTAQGNLIQSIVGDIGRSIPTGFSKHQEYQDCLTADKIKLELSEYDGFFEYWESTFSEDVENMYYQIGTLGGGNHFIELQEDEEGFLCIMIHSGSRNFGYKVAKYFNKVAVELNKKYYSSVPLSHELAFLPVDSEEGKRYLQWMNYALNFAKENRQTMLIKVISIIKNFNDLIKYDDVCTDMLLDVHHNYASIESHNGVNVWVHRKGAIQARDDQLGIIPGAMGSYSYITRGKGNPDSFMSCSHGAGRKMSRKKAKETFTHQQMMEDLNNKGVILSTRNKEDVVDESRFAYKDIKDVMNNQEDLLTIVQELKTVAVLKASESGKRVNNKGEE